MVKQVLLLVICLFFAFEVWAQIPDPCPPNSPAAEDCDVSCIYCNFNNYMGSTEGYAGGSAPGFCAFIQNDQWLGFIAGQTTNATFTATSSNCTGTNGVQIAIYESCSASAPIDCNPGVEGGAGGSVSVTAPLVSGTNYYLLIDGYSGDECDFVITVDPPAAVQAPPVGSLGAMTGPIKICPGGSTSFTVPNATGAGGYEWTVPNGWLINGEASPSVVLAPEGTTVTITAPSNAATGSVQICAEAINSCDQVNPLSCRTLMVQPIPVTTLTPVIVCNDEIPYTLPWGDDAFATNLYTGTYTSFQGCDSVVRVQVTVKPQITTNLGIKYICAGDEFILCGTIYENTGFYSSTCESYQGCDSIVTVNLAVLNPIADIQVSGSTSLTCINSSVTLNSAVSPGAGITKKWINAANNQIIGTNASIIITTPGTYILSVSANSVALTCTATDTIVVTSNTTPPVVGATATGVLGCTTTTVQLNATSNAPNSTYIWSGPGGFNSTIANPTATTAGTYTVVVRNPVNGCTATATAMVTGNTTLPIPTASGGILTCTTTTVQLSGNSNVPSSGYVWSGPSGFNSTLQNPNATASGTYTLVVTNPTNGCTASTTTSVTLNNTPPGATATTTGTITCPTPSATLNTATTNGITFAWTGPNSYTASTQNPSASEAGTYTVVVTGANGCTSTSTTSVTGNIIAPNASAVGGTISCGTPAITINGNSITNGVTYAWAGPGGFISNLQNPSVNAQGIYTLTVTGTNACTSTATADVQGNFGLPQASATGGIITCSQSTTTISGSSTTPNASFAWVGPGNFTSNLATVTVSTIGTYTLTVTGPNGCTATANAPVDPDANVPNATASGGLLNCNVATVTLNGNTTTPGTTFAWTGPNGFTSALEDPTVSVNGTYTFTVINPANGCQVQATAFVTLDDVTPNVTANGGILTCALPSFALQGNSTTPNVTWAWTGPGTFTSTVQNPTAMDAGTYTLVVTSTANGCTASTTTQLTADQNTPVASSTTGILTCTLQSLVLNGNSTLPSTYSWSGPSFTSSIQNPTVTVGGDYTLTVTSGNGCTDVATVTVGSDKVAPGATTVGDTLTCAATQIQINANSTAGILYAWTGPNNFTSTQQNPTVGNSGLYTVLVTGANGCTSTANATVSTNTNTASLSIANPQVLTCALPNVPLNATIGTNPSSPLQSVAWTGPSSFTSTIEDPIVMTLGTYILTATFENGCSTSTQVAVTQDIDTPGAVAQGGTITCVVLSTVLNATSTSLAASYAWAGPNSFTSSLEDPTVTESGTYTLVVTGVNGCISTATASVILDAILPTATAASSNNLDCDELSTLLSGMSATNGVGYAWAGPNNYTSTVQNPTVDKPGDYVLTVTALNGCKTLDTISVSQNIVIPDASVTGATIDCISGQAPLSASSNTASVTYAWTGPNNFTSTQQNPTVGVDGNYVLTVTALNGCTFSATAIVLKNTLSPEVSLAGAGTITCLVEELTLVGTIVTPNATGVWTLPNGQTNANSSITVSAPGIYTYVVTAQNGCVSSPTSTVDLDTDSPEGLTATGGLINCSFPTISIASSSTTAGVQYAWSGPGGYTSAVANPNNIVNAGTYTIVVTNPTNGCTSSQEVEVTQDPTVPDILVAADSLTCLVPSVTLEATTTTAGVTFQWSGPNGFSSTLEDPSVSAPGDYVVVATATSGCTASFNYNIIQNINLPNLTASGDTITCTVPTGTLVSASTTAGVSYAWTGPGGFTSTVPSPTVSLTGTYTIVVTSSNGCTSVKTVEIAPDASIPQVSVSTGVITCNVTSVQLGATSNNTPAATWLWTGPGITAANSTLQNPTVTVAGNYTVVATAPNGCDNTTGGSVIADTQGPTVSIPNPNDLNCTTTQVPLNVNVPTQGTFSYVWTTTNGNILTSANAPSITVSQAGTYAVVVTNTANGCTSEDNTDVETDDDLPQGAFAIVDSIKCFGQTNGVILIDSIAGGTPPYLYSLDNSPLSGGGSFSGLPPGEHLLLVQDANGCEYETTIDVFEPALLTLDLGADTTIFLGETIVLSLAGTVNFPDRVVNSVLNPATLALDSVITPFYSFRYTASIADENGCKANDQRDVIVDKRRLVYIPNVFDPNSTENNLFGISGGIDVKIVKYFYVYDRWGNAVHEYSNFIPDEPASKWNGKIRGKSGNNGVYVYAAAIEFIDGEVVIYKGDITLMGN